MQQNQQSLLQLIYSKENQQFQQIKKKFSQYVKYFFNVRRSITIAYDKPILYIIHKEHFNVIDLGKNYTITNLAYNYKKNIVLFLTQDGYFYAYFMANKVKIQIKHDFKKIMAMEWIYSQQTLVSFFVAEEGGIHMYKIEEEKKEKGIKQVKSISGKYNCFLYQPTTEYLAAFHNGDCENAYIFHFDAQKGKNWFKNGEIQVSFRQDEGVIQKMKQKKRLGLQGNRISKPILVISTEQQNFIDIICIRNTPYMVFYYTNEGKLQLTPLAENSQKKTVIIKLPSNTPPGFNVYDNMLLVHLRTQKITFIYDIYPTSFQPLVSPYTMTHEDPKLNQQIYSNQFVGYRAVLTNRHISKWKIKIQVIYSYLKNQIQVFQFLSRRAIGKIETIKWMRQNLFTFRQINLSKMWKAIFGKISSGTYDESQIISMIEIYTNLFYTLSIDPLVNKVALTNILIQCLRQAYQYRIVIPSQLQLFTVQLLLTTQRYDLLSFLCHHNFIRNDNKIYKVIFERGQALNQQSLVTLSVDLAYQSAPPKAVLRIIMKSQRIKEGKRYIKIHYQKLDPLDILQSAKYIKDNDAKIQFVSYFRNFIPRNYQNFNAQALLQAEKKLFQ